MKIVVIGGSGLIGRKLVDRLRQRGHEAMAASPASGVDTITGQGLAEALAGAQVVVDVANSPSRGTSSYASCGVCEREVPVSEAAVREASDYMAHFCGLECYARWRNQSL